MRQWPRPIALALHAKAITAGVTTMIGLKRGVLALVAAAGLVAASGCCCCSPCNSCGSGCGLGLLCGRDFPDDYRGAGSYWCDCGCGELYCGDWHSYPPDCDPCDCCGNYIGPQNHVPGYQLPPRWGTTGRAPPPPVETSTPKVAPPPPTPPTSSSPSTSRRRRSSGAVQASYNAPQQQHCATCGN